MSKKKTKGTFIGTIPIAASSDRARERIAEVAPEVVGRFTGSLDDVVVGDKVVELRLRYGPVAGGFPEDLTQIGNRVIEAASVGRDRIKATLPSPVGKWTREPR